LALLAPPRDSYRSTDPIVRDTSASIVVDFKIASNVAHVDRPGAVVAHDHAALDPRDPHAAGTVRLDDDGAGTVDLDVSGAVRHGHRPRDVHDPQIAGAVLDLQRGHVADLGGAAAVFDVQGERGRDFESEVEAP